MYEYKTQIKLHQTDAAGLLFFSHQLEIMHDAYEALLESIGFSFATLIRDKEYFLPIVHAAADYEAPLFVGDRITVQISVERIGTTSFTFGYRIFKLNNELVGKGITVHVTMNKSTKTKIPLPESMRKAIELFKDN